MSSVEVEVDRKQRSIEAIIERNAIIENRLTEALSLLHNMEERLIGDKEPVTKEDCSADPSCSHLPALQRQQDRIEATCIKIIDSIAALQEHI